MDVIMKFPHLPKAMQEAILNGPAMPPPPGVTPDFSKPGNRNGMAIAFSVVCMCLVFCLYVVRCYARALVLKRFKIEDYLGVFALLSYIGCLITFYYYLHLSGFFVRQYNVRFRDYQQSIRTSILLTMMYSFTMIFAKSAILVEWCRIFSPHGSKRGFFWWTCHVMMVLNTLLYSSTVIGEAVSCIPLNKTWEPWRSGTCINKKALDISTAYFNLVVDTCILLLPQLVIWRLKLSGAKKAGVSIIFSLGILTLACAIGRVYANHHVAYVNEGDTNYTLAPLYMWGLAEATCVMIVFCIPAVPKAFSDGWLATHVFPSVRSWIHMSFSRTSRGSTSPESNALSTWHVKTVKKNEHSPTHSKSFSQDSQTELSYAQSAHSGLTPPQRSYSPGQSLAVGLGGITRKTELLVEHEESTLKTLKNRQESWA